MDLIALRIPSSGMWRRVDLVSTDVSEERIASILRVNKFRARNQCDQVAPKRRPTQDLQGATSQKTAFFIVTAVNFINFVHKHFTFQVNFSRGSIVYLDKKEIYV
jgi:hypothetical protein